MSMPALGDADIFRIRGFEAPHGVNTDVELTDNSVRQYSRAQLEREDKARQLVDKPQKKESAINDKEDIDVTISEDLGEGQISKLDACLELLSEDDRKLLLPTDHLDDDELHIIETTLNVAGGGNHALQDYQMQLMLLEQQNKKRLLMARQEQDNRVPQLPELKLSANYKQTYPSILERGPEKEVKKIEKAHEGAGGNLARDLWPIQALHKMSKRHSEDANMPTDERRKRTQFAQSPQHDLDDWDKIDSSSLGETLAPAAADTPLPPPPPPPPPPALPHTALVYRVSCGDQYAHPMTDFYDVPRPDKMNPPIPFPPGQGPLDSDSPPPRLQHSHLNGSVPVFDLQTFMENEEDDIAFVIIRTIECSRASVMMAQASGVIRWTESIYMKSEYLKYAMQQVVTCYFQPLEHQYQSWDSSRRMPTFEQNHIYPADLVFFHHRHLLRSWSTTHAESKAHMDALFHYIKNQYGADFSEADSLFAQGLVTQAHILKLFKPNDLIVSGTYGKPAAFVLQEWPALGNDGWITLVCWSFQTDGNGFARKRSTLSIPPLQRETWKIESLVAYPLRFASPELQSLIRQRGEKQWELRVPTQITYKGWNVGGDEFFPDARFMIDHTVYHKMHPYARAFTFEKPKTTHLFDRMPAYLRHDEEPSELCFLLMQPDIHGFYLNEKKWIKLFVDNVEPVTWNKKAFERLVLPDQTKDLVRGLVTVRTSQRGVKQGLGIAGKRTDITSGKGNGLIMLLHGGPGTGKTLTAESVAEIAEMPLYRVTCGDIGTSAEAVEKYLNTVLHLGKTWNCVLLLDEADVFLEERSMADLKRNSLVSVFLRILEYYDGILILTSNRIGMFDEAFKSRIQVALHYENLNRSSRKKIWQNFLEMLEEDEEDVNFGEIRFRLDDLAGRELNGRQIRNVLTTARQLAIYRNERLDWAHLEQALTVSSDFNNYLKRMQGHNDDQRARDIGLR